jgi:NADH dehydrogenase [ubiquinone] 1 alpha subcomplex assembly factor 5
LVVGDEEFIPFQKESLDLVISNLSLHWVNDLPGTFTQIRYTLKPDGLFLGSMFGENTLKELRSALILAEQEREGSISPHISPFAGVSDIGNLLSRAHFNLTTIDTESITVRYASPYSLLKDLKGMAESNAVTKRRNYLQQDTLHATAAIYNQLYGFPDGSVPATFQVIYFIGWAPHESQQKPKKRGSAKVSMKTLGEGNNL